MTRTRTITRQQAEDVLDNFTDIGGELPREQALRDSYSGRGMFGKQCLGFVISPSSILLFGMAMYQALSVHDDDGIADDQLAVDMGQAAQTDSMGTDAIVYFPGWTLAEEETADETAQQNG